MSVGILQLPVSPTILPHDAKAADADDSGVDIEPSRRASAPVVNHSFDRRRSATLFENGTATAAYDHSIVSASSSAVSSV